MARKLKIGKEAKMSMPVEIKGIDKETFTLTMVASTQTVDRHGDTVMQAGWDLKPYTKNPVILNSHRYNDATDVIAKAVNTRIEGKGKRAKLIQEWVFAVAENPKAQIIFDLYAGGFLHASSVGFIPRKFAETKDGARDWSVIEEAELLEVSAVSVPANAMALAKSKGLNVDALDDEDIEDEETEPTEPETTPETDVEPEVEETPDIEPEIEEEPPIEPEPEEQEPDVEETPAEKTIRLKKELSDHEEENPEPEPEEVPEPTPEPEKEKSYTERCLQALTNIEAKRVEGLKSARASIDVLLKENGLPTLDEETKGKIHKRKVNKVIRKLMKLK